MLEVVFKKGIDFYNLVNLGNGSDKIIFGENLQINYID